MKAITIAKYIIDKCTLDSNPISNLQLQKILYCLQRYYLRIQKLPLFEDDFQAWQFGPVILEVYYHYCGAGASKITLSYPDVEIEYQIADTINPIIDDNRNKPPWELADKIQQPGMAWATIFRNGEGIEEIIPKTLIHRLG